MGMRSKKQFMTAALAVEAIFCLNAVRAAPPQGHADQIRAQSQIQPMGQHLDLRAPSPAFETAEKMASFPSMLHRQSPASEEQIRLPASSPNNMRSRSSAEEYVQRVHREGLPVARLFESSSALVHLGLNPKGKPGLWLVQKTR
jgi:hypothetical protein